MRDTRHAFAVNDGGIVHLVCRGRTMCGVMTGLRWAHSSAPLHWSRRAAQSPACHTIIPVRPPRGAQRHRASPVIRVRPPRGRPRHHRTPRIAPHKIKTPSAGTSADGARRTSRRVVISRRRECSRSRFVVRFASFGPPSIGCTVPPESCSRSLPDPRARPRLGVWGTSHP